MLGGWNWYLNFVGVIFLLVLTVSGFVAWWKRRPAGSVDVPVAPLDSRLGAGLLLLVIVLGVFLPMVGISLILALLLDWLLL